jgi:predicted nuclease of predicted toxin-antitoxin system
MILILDVHLSPFIVPWIIDNFKLECTSFHQLGWQTLEDEEAFLRARKMNAVVISKDEDFVDLLKKYSAPPKVIWLTCGNTSNQRLKQILTSNLSDAIDLLSTNELVEISDSATT